MSAAAAGGRMNTMGSRCVTSHSAVLLNAALSAAPALALAWRAAQGSPSDDSYG